ncbi:peptidoglycan-associated lipoprotein Pal [Acetobacteraceae bacterium]|nr:peptidoglycan-associated lipoprotein Pal [Acetobacteraceae bacterium]
MNFKVLGATALGMLLVGCSGHHHHRHDIQDQSTEVSDNTVTTTSTETTTSAAVVTPGSEADLVATAGDRVYYALNQNRLTDADKVTLDKQAAWLAQYPKVNIIIAGNCDDRGTQEYNLALGARRANAARDYLEAKGVASSRIKTISYGKERPALDGDTPEAWSANRNAITSVR